jgi:hypothetical protein
MDTEDRTLEREGAEGEHAQDEHAQDEPEPSTEFGPGAQGDGMRGIPRPEPSRGRAAARRVAEAEDEHVVEQGVRMSRPSATPADEADATAWMLAAWRDEVPAAEHVLRLNVGSLSRPTWIRWRIRAVRRDVIEKLRDESLPSQNRAMRRSGASVTAQEQQQAQWKLNLRLVRAGTIEPDIGKVMAESGGFKDADVFLEDVFKNNSGLVDIISNSILTLSGYDEDNVQDEIEGAATGN